MNLALISLNFQLITKKSEKDMYFFMHFFFGAGSKNLSLTHSIAPSALVPIWIFHTNSHHLNCVEKWFQGRLVSLGLRQSAIYTVVVVACSCGTNCELCAGAPAAAAVDRTKATSTRTNHLIIEREHVNARIYASSGTYDYLCMCVRMYACMCLPQAVRHALTAHWTFPIQLRMQFVICMRIFLLLLFDSSAGL